MTLDPPRGLPEGADPWRYLGLSRVGLARFLRSARQATGLLGSLDILLTDDRTLRRLNRSFRGKDKATDVLSFPAHPQLGGAESPAPAGDLAISVETAARQAAEHGHTLAQEVRILLLHGFLHLQGMDHESDRGEMARREGELRAQLRLPAGLIARAGAASAKPAPAKRRAPTPSLACSAGRAQTRRTSPTKRLRTARPA